MDALQSEKSQEFIIEHDEHVVAFRTRPRTPTSRASAKSGAARPSRVRNA
jgi:hypothetical protein